ncbi:hypothetical protein ACFX2B_002386 [Malus domestica]
MKNHRNEGVRRRMGYQDAFDVPPISAAGGLSLWWNGTIEVNILSSSKNLIHSELRVRGEPRFLQDFMNTMELIDLGFTSSKFTWHGTRNNSLVQERLDRGLVNGGMWTKNLFKFEAFWCKESGCKEIIERTWNMDVEGSWLNKWHKKIQATKRNLKRWSDASFRGR